MAAQRDRLLRATAHGYAAGDASAAAIIARAGVGRASFYELFDDAQHALLTVRQHALTRFARALRRGRELPVTSAGLEELCWLWLAATREDPAAALVALDSKLPELSPATELFRRALLPWLRAAQSSDAGFDPDIAVAPALVVAQWSATRAARHALGTTPPPLAGDAAATGAHLHLEPVAELAPRDSSSRVARPPASSQDPQLTRVLAATLRSWLGYAR